MNRQELAVEYKHSGLNCCQAVLLAFEDKTALDRDTLVILGAPFGLGMGNMKGNCGALVGAQMLLGLLTYDGGSRAPLRKSAGDVYNTFKEMCHETICAELKGFYSGYVLCSCEDCVKNAVKIIEDVIDKP